MEDCKYCIATNECNTLQLSEDIDSISDEIIYQKIKILQKMWSRVFFSFNSLCKNIKTDTSTNYEFPKKNFPKAVLPFFIFSVIHGGFYGCQYSGFRTVTVDFKARRERLTLTAGEQCLVEIPMLQQGFYHHLCWPAF